MLPLIVLIEGYYYYNSCKSISSLNSTATGIITCSDSFSSALILLLRTNASYLEAKTSIFNLERCDSYTFSYLESFIYRY